MTTSSNQEMCAAAHAFFEAWQAHPESHPPPQEKAQRRLTEIEAEIAATGTYTHTLRELEFGARLAWKNSNRCIGRHLWRSLEVRDFRSLHTQPNREKNMLQALESHVEDGFRDGKIKNIISIFAARTPGQTDRVRMVNHQLIRYAGFSLDGTRCLGDPDSVEQTNYFLNVGWKPAKRSNFTLLPWQFYWEGVPGGVTDVMEAKPALAREITITHPDNTLFNRLGLRWYALPVLADMALKIGGVIYPFAPFNGHYMGTEIGARNLGDVNRYNVLPEVAACFGLAIDSERSLWRDRALVELNRAVLFSFDQAGVTIGDHHNLGAQFEAFCQHESGQSRTITGDWSWLTPPISASATPQFHRTYENDVVKHTNFFYQEPIWKQKPKTSPSSSGRCPFHL